MTVADAYLETRVLTAAPQQLHLLVLEGAIRYAEAGATALENQDRAKAHLALGRSREFVTELLSGIQPQPLAELADQMKQLFLFIHRNLVQGDLRQEIEPVRAALQILKQHRDTWRELLAQLPREHRPAETAIAATESGGRSWST